MRVMTGAKRKPVAALGAVAFMTGCLATPAGGGNMSKVGPLPKELGRLSPAGEMSIATLRTRAELPPVIPAFAPPGETRYVPPEELPVVVGLVVGARALSVWARTVNLRDASFAEVSDDQRFTFKSLSPFRYKLSVLTGLAEIPVRGTFEIHPERRYQMEISISNDGAMATTMESPR